MQLQLKINTHKIKKKGKGKQNKTKNNSNGKWSKASYVVSSNNSKNKNHFPYLVHIKVAIMISLICKEKMERLKESICLYLDMVSTG